MVHYLVRVPCGGGVLESHDMIVFRLETFNSKSNFFHLLRIACQYNRRVLSKMRKIMNNRRPKYGR